MLTPKNRSFEMKERRWHVAILVLGLTIMMVPVLGAQEPNSTPSASEQRAMAVLKNMSEYLARAERFGMTMRHGYDAVQQSGQKIEYGAVRKVTVSRPDRLRIEVERSDGEKGLVI